MTNKQRVNRNILDQLFKRFSLTVRELEVLEALTEGHTSSKSLADHLKISESTANNHIDNISKKTGLPGKTCFLSYISRELFLLLESREIQQKPQTVLIIDDEKELSDILRSEFDDRGYRTFVVSQAGEDTIELIKNEKVDLIVCDVVMPGMTGPEFLNLAKAKMGYLPATVFISAYDAVEPAKIRELGVYSLVKKPFRFGELLDTSIEALKTQSAVGA